jgi:hypothetical protein
MQKIFNIINENLHIKEKTIHIIYVYIDYNPNAYL